MSVILERRTKPVGQKLLLRFNDTSNYGKLKFNDTHLEVSTKFNPAQYSVTKATIESVPDGEEFYKKGDTVLVHYMVFVYGIHRDLSGQPSRNILDDIYWAKNPKDIDERPEVFCKILSDGTLVPKNGVIIKKDKKPKESVRKEGLLYLPHSKEDRVSDFFIEKVCYSGVDGIEQGDSILIRKSGFIEMDHEDFCFVMARNIIRINEKQ